MRPARLKRAIAAPTWFGRTPLHAAAISCCVLPIAKARTCSLRLGEVRLPPAGLAAVARRRLPDRAEAAVFVAQSSSVPRPSFSPAGLCRSARAPARPPPVTELVGELLALSIDPRERLADSLLLLGDFIQCRHSVPSRKSRGWPGLIPIRRG